MALVKVFMFVVLGAAQVVTKQEKIKQNYFNDSDFGFKYSSAFAFNPFTPFPELLSTTPITDLLSSSTTPRPISSTNRSKQSKSEIIDREILNTEPTTTKTLTTKTATKKVIILRKKISKKTKKKSPPDLTPKRGTNLRAGQETEGQNVTHTDGTGQDVTVRDVAGKNGYRVISDKPENKQKRIRSKTDTNMWVQSILSRTTRRPATTTTTPAPTPSTTTAPILTRELQLKLQKLLARKNLPEQSRSSSYPQYFKTKQFSDTKTSSQTYNFPGQPNFYEQQFMPQQQFTPQHELAHSQQQVSPSHQQLTLNTGPDSRELLNLQQKTALTQKFIQNFIQPQQSSGTKEYNKAILSQQQSHQAFLKKNRFRLKAQNFQQQYSKHGQQPQYGQKQQYSKYGQKQQFQNELSSPLQQHHYQQQSYQGQYYKRQQQEQRHQQQTLNHPTPQQQFQYV